MFIIAQLLIKCGWTWCSTSGIHPHVEHQVHPQTTNSCATRLVMHDTGQGKHIMLVLLHTPWYTGGTVCSCTVYSINMNTHAAGCGTYDTTSMVL